jgi:hypothetical protein
MATLHIEIPDQRAAALTAYAEAHGLTVEQWFLQLAEQASPSSSEPPTVEDNRPIWEIFVDSMKDVPAEILATMPKDGASQHDHYIYGWPKREE